MAAAAVVDTGRSSAPSVKVLADECEEGHWIPQPFDDTPRRRPWAGRSAVVYRMTDVQALRSGYDATGDGARAMSNC
jgi:hypothetical protein